MNTRREWRWVRRDWRYWSRYAGVVVAVRSHSAVMDAQVGMVAGVFDEHSGTMDLRRSDGSTFSAYAGELGWPTRDERDRFERERERHRDSRFVMTRVGRARATEKRREVEASKVVQLSLFAGLLVAGLVSWRRRASGGYVGDAASGGL